MKVSAYFFDKYTKESIWLALMLWPLYFHPFYLMYKQNESNKNNFLFPLIASLIMASFTCLFFADTLIEYLIFFLGVGTLLFGCMAMMHPSKESGIGMIVGIIVTVLAGLMLYSLRTILYKRDSIPNTRGELNTLKTPGAWIWIIIQVFLYMYILWMMFKEKNK